MKDRELTEHRLNAMFENIDFLRDTCGLQNEQIARRLGMTPDALEKALERRRNRGRRRDTDNRQDPGSSEVTGQVSPLRTAGR